MLAMKLVFVFFFQMTRILHMWVTAFVCVYVTWKPLKRERKKEEQNKSIFLSCFNCLFFGRTLMMTIDDNRVLTIIKQVLVTNEKKVMSFFSINYCCVCFCWFFFVFFSRGWKCKKVHIFYVLSRFYSENIFSQCCLGFGFFFILALH